MTTTRAVAPADGIFVLEGDLETRAAVVVDAFDHGVAAQEALGGAALDVGDLAAEQQFAVGCLQCCGNRILVRRWRARRTSRPRAIAWVVVWRMPCVFTSAPVRGALQVAAIEPTSVQTLRLMRSIHFQLAARATMTSLSRMSARVSGNIGRSAMAKLVI